MITFSMVNQSLGLQNLILILVLNMINKVLTPVSIIGAYTLLIPKTWVTRFILYIEFCNFMAKIWYFLGLHTIK